MAAYSLDQLTAEAHKTDALAFVDYTPAADHLVAYYTLHSGDGGDHSLGRESRTAMTALRARTIEAEGRGIPAVRHPEVEVQLSGQDGNAFAVLGAVSKALRRARVSAGEIDAFTAEATSGDYDHLLATAQQWVTVS